MKKVIIVQARTGSTRLPGKILKKVLGRTLLECQIERLKKISLADDLVIATTTKKADNQIVDLVKNLGVKYYRGSEEDVLSRYYEAAKKNNADLIIRITSDSPLNDPEIIDYIIKFYLDNQSKFDFVTVKLKKTLPSGVGAEVFPFHVLEQAHFDAGTQPEREHVSPYIYLNPQIFRIGNFEIDQDLSLHRWSLDEQDDFILIEKIITALYPDNPNFGMKDCLDLLQMNPEWININAHVKPKNTVSELWKNKMKNIFKQH